MALRCFRHRCWRSMHACPVQLTWRYLLAVRAIDGHFFVAARVTGAAVIAFKLEPVTVHATAPRSSACWTYSHMIGSCLGCHSLCATCLACRHRLLSCALNSAQERLDAVDSETSHCRRSSITAVQKQASTCNTQAVSPPNQPLRKPCSMRFCRRCRLFLALRLSLSGGSISSDVRCHAWRQACHALHSDLADRIELRPQATRLLPLVFNSRFQLMHERDPSAVLLLNAPQCSHHALCVSTRCVRPQRLERVHIFFVTHSVVTNTATTGRLLTPDRRCRPSNLFLRPFRCHISGLTLLFQLCEVLTRRVPCRTSCFSLPGRELGI